MKKSMKRSDNSSYSPVWGLMIIISIMIAGISLMCTPVNAQGILTVPEIIYQGPTGPLSVDYKDHSQVEIQYPYREVVTIKLGNDTLHLTTIHFNQGEYISTLHSKLADEYVYTGEYEDIELLIKKCKEFPPNTDNERWMWSYYNEFVDTYIIN